MYGAAAELLPVEDQSLAELHERARPPRRWDEPDDDEPAWAETDRRIRSLLTEDTPRTPRATWRRWRAYGKRHGTEHPEQTEDRVQRHQAAEAARTARIDAQAAGRVQDRFDPRTAPNVASSARQSRALNARYVDQPPMPAPRFDFQGESVSGGPYGYGRASGQRPGRTGYAWNMEDGFTY